MTLPIKNAIKSPLKMPLMAKKFSLKHYYRKIWINRQSMYLDFKIQAGFFINEGTCTRKMMVCLF